MNIEITLPELSGNAACGDVVSILVREGDVVGPDDAVIELETDKTVLEIPSRQAGKVTKLLVAKGQTVKIGEPVLMLEVEGKVEAKAEGKTGAKPRASKKAKTPAATTSETADSMPAETKSETAATAPSAPASEGMQAQRGTREPSVPPGALSEDAFGPVRREPLSRMRRASAERMVKASAAPHVTIFDDADVTELERLCKTIPPAYLGPTIKLTSMPFVMKAVAMALRQHPALNASLDEAKDEIIYKQYIHLGMAIDTPHGIAVPVMQHVDRLGVLHLARELTLLAARARSATFHVEELQGGTFTIYNQGGVAGGIYGTPLIHQPEVAVLMLGRTRWVLAAHEGKIEGRLMSPLSLTYDPRVVDGSAAGRFLGDTIDYLQSPGKLLLVK
jgi:pyruvate dehydrogenase E2 component (dihydrolipoamide acetyltransferase)